MHLRRLHCIAAFFLTACHVLPAAAASRTLEMFTWADYIHPDVVAEFERAHDVTIEFTYFSSDEERDQTLAAAGGGTYDLVLVNRPQLRKYANRGWIQPVDPPQVSNLALIDQRWRIHGDDIPRYGVPYFWGTMGIAYRSDLVTDPPATWMELLNPPEALRDRLLMPASTRELLAYALKANGRSVNEGGRQHLNDAAQLLLQQKPYVHLYGYPALSALSALVTGRVWMSPMYNGDVLMLQQYDPSIRFLVPSEGGLLWVDYLAIGANSSHTTLAHRFIDFLNRPQIAARQARYLHFATPNLAANAHLPDDFLAHPVIYPSTGIIDRSEFLQPLPPRSQRRVNAIGAEIMLQDWQE